MLVVALRSLPGPVSPSAATPTPGVPRAHPRQRGPPHLIVAVGHLAGKIQRHAGVIIEDIFGLVALLTRLVLFMPSGPFMCYCRTHVAVSGHGAAGPLEPLA